MIKDMKIVVVLALFGGFFYWVTVDHLGSSVGGVEFFRNHNNSYVVALILAAVIGVLADRNRWLPGSLVVASQMLLGGPSGTLNPAAAFFFPAVILGSVPAAFVAELAGRTFWHYWRREPK